MFLGSSFMRATGKHERRFLFFFKYEEDGGVKLPNSQHLYSTTTTLNALHLQARQCEKGERNN